MTDYRLLKKLKTLGLSEFEYKETVKRLSREPNELELYLFSAMWSEHCGYKHSKKQLSKLPSANSVLKGENSGGIRIGNHIIFFKTESHNHPSAVEPYQGAATGIGGILRDILAMNARPIALLNSLKFGPAVKSPYAGEFCTESALKRNKYLLNGVVEGISDYGNSTGVPTIGGEVSFDKAFNLSPLVNVMAVGICRKDKVKTAAARKNAYIVLIGSPTGRDGLFGAAFASKKLENNFEDRLSVQIGDPYIKKNVIEATLEILKSRNVYASQDLGAAGLLSSTSEMAAKGRVSVSLWLEKVPLREKNMCPYEIMLSESQERMVFCANKRGAEEIKKICAKYELNADIIGKTEAGNSYNLYYNGKLEASVPVNALTEPVLYDLKPLNPYPAPYLPPKTTVRDINIKELIFKMAAAPEFASKKHIFQRYDSSVGLRTFKNPHSLGVAPLYIPEEAVTVGFSMDSNETACALNPYQGAFNTVFEAFRNAVSSGFEPLGITDCLNFGNPENPLVAAQFVQTIEGIKDALKLLKIPVVSGNVSFYNECAPDCSLKGALDNDFAGSAIPPSPVIGMLSLMKSKSPVYAEFKPGDTLYLAGKKINQKSCTGASLYKKIFFNDTSGTLDTVDFGLEMKLKKTIFQLNKKGLISGAIDISKGGILGSLVIMLSNTINNSCLNAGFKGEFEKNPEVLFGEITGRYLLCTPKPAECEKYFLRNGVPFEKLGKADNSGVLDIGFAKIRAAELAEIYFNSLEGKLC